MVRIWVIVSPANFLNHVLFYDQKEAFSWSMVTITVLATLTIKRSRWAL